MPLPQPSSATPPNAKCPQCGRQVLLRQDGTLRAHTYRKTNLPWQSRCPGSHVVPQDA